MRKTSLHVHIPKTAGTSIHYSLGEPRLPSHDTMAFMALEEPEALKVDVIYTFIRDPWQRALSWYMTSEASRKYETFEGWVLDGMKPYWNTRGQPRILHQEDWIFIDGKVAVDFVGTFENLHADYERLCNLLGVEPRPELQKRIHRPLRVKPWCFYADYRVDYTKYYTDEMRAIVAPVFKDFCDWSGYRFGESCECM